MKKVLLTLAVAAATASVPATAGADARTFTVNTTAEPSGLTNCPPFGGIPCTLRTAIQQNENDHGGDTIVVPPGHYKLSAGTLDVRMPVTIEGQGAAGETVIDANGTGGIFRLFGGAASLSHLTITGAEGAPAIAAFDVLPLTLDDVVVRDNDEAIDGDVAGLELGGSNGTDASITNSSFIRNVGGEAGAIDVGPSPNNHLRITDSELRDNAARDLVGSGGGALLVQRGSVDIARSRFGWNSAPQGGAISIAPLGDVVVSASDSTFDDDRATLGAGGAVFVDPAMTPGATRAFKARSDTFFGDAAVADGGAFGGATSDISLRTSVLAGNSAAACDGGIASLGENVADDTSCALGALGDREGVDPRLGPVTDNGGPTLTAAPLADSPLLDVVDSATCSATDERGIARPQGAGCDIGAVERVDDGTSGGGGGTGGGGTGGGSGGDPGTGSVSPGGTTPAQGATTAASKPALPALVLSALHVGFAPTGSSVTLSWKATQAGRVRFTVERKQHGHWRAKAHFTLRAQRGANRQAFPKSVLRKLAPGSYRLELTTTGSRAHPHVAFHYAPKHRA